MTLWLQQLCQIFQPISVGPVQTNKSVRALYTAAAWGGRDYERPAYLRRAGRRIGKLANGAP